MPDISMLEAAIRTSLDEIKDPCSLAAGTPLGLDEMGLVKSVSIGPQGDVEVALRLTSPFCHMIGFFKTEATRRIEAIGEFRSVNIRADNGLDWSPSDMSPAARTKRSEQVARMESAGAA